MNGFTLNRRHFLASSAVGIAALAMGSLAPALAAREPAADSIKRLAALAPIKQVSTDILDISYYEAGPEEGRAVILLHGAAGDIQSFAGVAPLLAAQGLRVIVPYLRGHGSTVYLDDTTPRSEELAVLGQDVIDLMNALHVPEAVLAGYAEGGRAASTAALLKPTRCVGLVSLNQPPQDTPSVVADVVVTLAKEGKWRT
ncbi:alpha/beta fold hydrolase [Pseudomonas sp. NPDC090202]|uniref:alpha/beta fold hydrolase n=1 Tax=unclassified Pseudomonas TaxID=196821 RepID=UPI003828B766